MATRRRLQFPWHWTSPSATAASSATRSSCWKPLGVDLPGGPPCSGTKSSEVIELKVLVDTSCVFTSQLLKRVQVRPLRLVDVVCLVQTTATFKNLDNCTSEKHQVPSSFPSDDVQRSWFAVPRYNDLWIQLTHLVEGLNPGAGDCVVKDCQQTLVEPQITGDQQFILRYPERNIAW